MKQVTQQLFHAYLTFDFKKVETFAVNNLDPLGKSLLYILFQHHLIQLKDPPTNQEIKTHLDQYFFQPIQRGSWHKDEDYRLLVLLLLLGKKEWQNSTQFHLAKLYQMLTRNFLDTYFNQPLLLKMITELSDLKSKLSFVSILKGIYYTLLAEDLLAIKYLQDHDAAHRGIAHYYLLLIALKQQRIERIQNYYQLLKQDNFYQRFLDPLHEQVNKIITTYEQPKFLKDIANLSSIPEIDKYITNTFSKRILDMMHEDTRKMIQSGFYITSRMTKLFLEGKIDDYSTFALPFVKAFELECYRLFKRDYLRFLVQEGIPPFQAIPSHNQEGKVDGLVKRQGHHYFYDDEGLNRFSIGQIPFIVGIPSHFVDPSNPESQLLDQAKIHPTFKLYWEKRMQKKPGFTSERVVKAIVKNTFLVKQIRNQIAHAEIITWAQLNEIVSLIFESGQIRNLVEMNGK